MLRRATTVRKHERRTRTGRVRVIKHNRNIDTALKVGMKVTIKGTMHDGKTGRIYDILSPPHPILVKLRTGIFAFDRDEITIRHIITEPTSKPRRVPRPTRPVPAPKHVPTRTARPTRKKQSTPIDFFQSMRTPRKPMEFFGVDDDLEESRTKELFLTDATKVVGKIKSPRYFSDKFPLMYDYWERSKSLPITGFRIIKGKTIFDNRVVFKNINNDYIVVTYAYLRELKRNIEGGYKAYFEADAPLFIKDEKNIFLIAPIVGEMYDYIDKAKQKGL